MKWWESGVRQETVYLTQPQQRTMNRALRDSLRIIAYDEQAAKRAASNLFGDLAAAIQARRAKTKTAKDEEQSSESALSDVSTAMGTVPGEGGGSGEFSKQLSDLGV